MYKRQDLPGPRANENLPGLSKSTSRGSVLTRDELKRQEREAIINALKQTHGRVSGPGGAAESLGMKPSTLASRLSSMGINPKALA